MLPFSLRHSIGVIHLDCGMRFQHLPPGVRLPRYRRDIASHACRFKDVKIVYWVS